MGPYRQYGGAGAEPPRNLGLFHRLPAISKRKMAICTPSQLGGSFDEGELRGIVCRKYDAPHGMRVVQARPRMKQSGSHAHAHAHAYMIYMYM